MAKTQAITTRTPFYFSVGAPIYAEDAIEVLEQLNWSFGKRPQVHLSQAVGDETWATNSVGTHWLAFRGTAFGWVEVIRTQIRILPETVNLVVGARCVFAASEDGEVKFTAGVYNYGTASWTSSTSTTLSVADTDNGNEVTGTIATSSSGTGWLDVVVEIRTTTGNAGNLLRNIRVQDQSITSSLPSPQNE